MIARMEKAVEDEKKAIWARDKDRVTDAAELLNGELPIDPTGFHLSGPERLQMCLSGLFRSTHR